jgi:hypothetical protein
VARPIIARGGGGDVDVCNVREEDVSSIEKVREKGKAFIAQSVHQSQYPQSPGWTPDALRSEAQ